MSTWWLAPLALAALAALAAHVGAAVLRRELARSEAARSRLTVVVAAARQVAGPGRDRAPGEPAPGQPFAAPQDR